MDSKSRLLIKDYVLPDTGAPIYIVSSDMIMMLQQTGMERTRDHWQRLIASVRPPLSIVDIWQTQKDPELNEAVIEVSLAS